VYRLIDRISGETLGTVQASDFKILRDVLVEEDLDDTDYYLQAATLEFLSEAGLGPDVLNLLQTALEHRPGELEMGWEKAVESPTAIVGRVVGLNGEAVPGCKVQLRQYEHSYWAFSREQGEFEVCLDADSQGPFELKLLGIGATEFWNGEIDIESGAVLDTGGIEVNANILSNPEPE
jgi:hypothetical protein